MYRSATQKTGVVCAAGVGALVLAGCGGIEVSGSDDDISAEKISAEAEEALAPKVRGDPRITCGSGLSTEDDDSTTCEMRVGDDPKTYEIQATLSVAGDRYSLGFRSEEYHPEAGKGTIFADEVARQAEKQLARNGTRPDITCANDLAGKVGATTRCVLSVGGDDTTYGVTVEVAGLDGSDYQLTFEVDDRPRRSDAST